MVFLVFELNIDIVLVLCLEGKEKAEQKHGSIVDAKLLHVLLHELLVEVQIESVLEASPAHTGLVSGTHVLPPESTNCARLLSVVLAQFRYLNSPSVDALGCRLYVGLRCHESWRAYLRTILELRLDCRCNRCWDESRTNCHLVM